MRIRHFPSWLPTLGRRHTNVSLFSLTTVFKTYVFTLIYIFHLTVILMYLYLHIWALSQSYSGSVWGFLVSDIEKLLQLIWI